MKGILAVVFAVYACLSLPLVAHEMGDGAHVEVIVTDSLQFQLDITFQELLALDGVDLDEDGRVSVAEQEQLDYHALDQYVVEHLQFSVDGTLCGLDITGRHTVRHPTGDYIQFAFAHGCGAPVGELQVDYHLFFKPNPYHQGTLTLVQGERAALVYFWDDQRSHRLPLQASHRREALMSVVLSGLKNGVHHIMVGYDHLLFLLCLLLPSVWMAVPGAPRGQRWQPSPAIRPVLVTVVQIVTAFTLAHSLTLCMTVLGWRGAPPSALVEVVIAASVILVGLKNILLAHRPWPKRWEVVLVLALGLVHGFGFASVLMEHALPAADLAWTLVAFNVGIELGQLALVAVVVPLLYVIRHWQGYDRFVLKGGSLSACVVAFVWLVERLG